MSVLPWDTQLLISDQAAMFPFAFSSAAALSPFADIETDPSPSGCFFLPPNGGGAHYVTQTGFKVTI